MESNAPSRRQDAMTPKSVPKKKLITTDVPAKSTVQNSPVPITDDTEAGK